MKTKRCNSCGNEKPFDAFYNDASKKDGHSSFCRDCRKKSSRAYYADNKDTVKVQQKQYRASHKAQICAQKRRWRDANLDYARSKSREWNRNHKERRYQTFVQWREKNRKHLRDYARSWRDLNREAYISYQRAYRKQNPHIILNAVNKRRAKIGKFADLTKHEWFNLMVQYEWRCFYCSRVLTDKTRTVDHIIPISRGGRHHMANLIPCCRDCNRKKNARIYPVWCGIMALDEHKQAHIVSRVIDEIHECQFQVTEDVRIDQLFKEVDRILKI